VSTDELEMCPFEVAETLFLLDLPLFELSRSTDESRGASLKVERAVAV
jgi:hypothetical protein